MAEPKYPLKEPLFDELVFDIVKMEYGVAFDGYALEKLRYDKNYDYITNQLQYKLTTFIPAEDMKHETHVVSVDYPKTWWDAFKLAYFPQWLLNRYPVDFTTKEESVTFTAYNLYPKFPYVVDCGDFQRQIIIKTVKSMDCDNLLNIANGEE